MGVSGPHVRKLTGCTEEKNNTKHSSDCWSQSNALNSLLGLGLYLALLLEQRAGLQGLEDASIKITL